MNKVLHGDCLELMKDILDKSIDMILCDLPYGTTQNKWDSVEDMKRVHIHAHPDYGTRIEWSDGLIENL